MWRINAARGARVWDLVCVVFCARETVAIGFPEVARNAVHLLGAAPFPGEMLSVLLLAAGASALNIQQVPRSALRTHARAVSPIMDEAATQSRIDAREKFWVEFEVRCPPLEREQNDSFDVVFSHRFPRRASPSTARARRAWRRSSRAASSSWWSLSFRLG